ncbi:hypothetical protein QAD02_006221 [Eretmocerus hayati]|uniref:Uncharacterized protein n=1 Tax=Eretmocerus hayati TaxID=131215 RepID=A0ACC2N0M5_9HYME|nr:hypothetical protein QAD02_006221 [Eretmocerus hayati]
MLARHLLFLATRRPKNTLLAVQQSEPITTVTCPQKPQIQQMHQYPQPPPYVEPPQVQRIHDNYPYQVVYENRSQQSQNHLKQGLPSLKQQEFQNYSHYDQNQQCYQQQHIIDSCHQHQPYTNYADNQKMYAHQQPISVYEKNHHHQHQQQQQFYTLPNRRPQREIIMEPQRSITPDITRGLARTPLSSMHMLARQGQKSISSERLAPQHHSQLGYNYQSDLNKRNLERQFEERCRIAEQQQYRQSPVDMRNRFASPVGLSAMGYRFFASPQQHQENLKNVTISPIGPEHTNGFRSSTPVMVGGGRVPPTVAERLALQSQRCISPNPALMQAADSGRSTPTGNNPNIILSPIKSTMSSEELFAAIHKSKKRLNIREDGESLSPAGSVSSLPGCTKTSSQHQDVIGGRHSWSPESQKTPEIPKTVLTPSATSRMDFKRLLLQQSIRAGPTRISAAEQLKLSRQQWEDAQHQQMQQPMPSIPTRPTPQQTAALSKVLSPRSAWRFHTPRTDVLSSTIIEDAAAEEKAMKPSPDNPPPVSKLPFNYESKKLDFSVDKEERRPMEKSEKEFENRLHADEARNKSFEENDPVKAIENRRISNQLARAQFLASNSVSSEPTPAKDLFSRRFRARSESPAQRSATNVSPSTVQAEIGNSVSRSPSAPALETAL